MKFSSSVNYRLHTANFSLEEYEGVWLKVIFLGFCFLDF